MHTGPRIRCNIRLYGIANAQGGLRIVCQKAAVTSLGDDGNLLTRLARVLKRWLLTVDENYFTFSVALTSA